MDDDESKIGKAAEKKDESIDHKTLKYSLLGPSLLKAGQDSVDQQKVSEIIYNASKGSKFFNNEEAKDKTLTVKISRILARKAELDGLDLTSDLRRADEYVASLELSRDLSQTVVHIDCDAFYAAVEELDRPELRDVPMAVGKGVLTTCNYNARRFGCRSGMAGFVARKLCPELVCLPLNFQKYTAKAQEVREVLAQYDPNFEAASVDEAYMNITEYCQQHDDMDPDEVVAQLRADVREQTGVTVSAGIAPNAKLAKICSNYNKPDGQFRIAASRQVVMDFMRSLSTRKVNGIGRVLERELAAVGVRTCGDIYSLRGQLKRLFGDKAFRFLIQCHLGLGRTQICSFEDSHERKSVGTESTFGELSGTEALREKLHKIAGELEKDLERVQVKGRTLVLKIKLHTYEVFTRQTVPPKALHRSEDLYRFALPMLTKLERESPGMRLRLMGLRMTNLVSTKKPDIDFFGVRSRNRGGTSSNTACDSPPRKALYETHNSNDGDGEGEGEWEAWPDEEFEAAALTERQTEMEEAEALSQEYDDSKNTEPPDKVVHASPPLPAAAKELWDCPICTIPQTADDRAFNDHVDFCLSRQTIRDAVRAASPAAAHLSTARATAISTAISAAISTAISASSKQTASAAAAGARSAESTSISTSASGKKRGRPRKSEHHHHHPSSSSSSKLASSTTAGLASTSASGEDAARKRRAAFFT